MHCMSYKAETMLDIWNSHKKCRDNVNALISERATVVELCEIKFRGTKLLRFIAPIVYENKYLYGKLKFGKPYLTGRKVNVSLGDAFGVSRDLRDCSVKGSEWRNFFRGSLK